ncbi:putative anti-sigma-M factor YhdL [Ruminiclostridium hungatei]|uniref:Putative anti-sigma-M factor YhdL n=1 Tax=Ruminiclostridium hungatei TaxID=48256 RepID=A0A1V4SNX4_RUMHU|nr:anti sigma factor C-terminal domain-containing protein [Ruminiclostridium hungatei]OPX44951.1 putative anti-sigma-M factor YhdL [Ruminiclostridium hungatei]
MTEDFKEKLDLYKKGELSNEEAEKVECELDRFTAMSEYLRQEEKLFEAELKAGLDSGVPSEKLTGKRINRRMVARIARVTVITLLACIVIVPLLYLSLMSVLGSVFRIDEDRFAQEQHFASDFIHMAFPDKAVIGGRNSTQFYKQDFSCELTKGISREAGRLELSVSYSFGRLKKPRVSLEEKLSYYNRDLFYAVNKDTYFNPTEWSLLEKAPSGTNAQIFVTYRHKLTPGEAKAALGAQYFLPSGGFTVDMLADTGSTLALANYNPSYYYIINNGNSSKMDDTDFINSFDSYDDETHKEVMLYGLEKIKENEHLASYISEYYTNGGRQALGDTGKMLEYVKNNGVLYIGAVISGDAKELLKLKENPEIYSCRVDEITVW